MSKEFLNLDDLQVQDALYSDDPIEDHIIRHLTKLKNQNKRLKEHIQKTGSWAHLKEVSLWKPFDFYHYFCSKYQDRYGKEYRQFGNITLAYQKIDKFRSAYEISKEEYKTFIDAAFEKYFNAITVPRIAHLCSERLYNALMVNGIAYKTQKEYQDLDQDLLREEQKFEEYVQQYND
jgi:hypothetical protein